MAQVERIAAYYDAVKFEQRYPELPTFRRTTWDLGNICRSKTWGARWPSIRPYQLFTLCTSGQVDWLLGDSLEKEIPSEAVCFCRTSDSGSCRTRKHVRSSLKLQGTCVEGGQLVGIEIAPVGWDSQCAGGGNTANLTGIRRTRKKLREDDVFIPAARIRRPIRKAPTVKAACSECLWGDGRVIAAHPRVPRGRHVIGIELLDRGLIRRGPSWNGLMSNVELPGARMDGWVYLRQLEGFWHEGPGLA